MWEEKVRVAGGEKTWLHLQVDKPVFLLLALGAVLRIGQYLAGTSLWGDELAVVLNVTSKHTSTLLAEPLNDCQVAPSGFLILLKLLVTLVRNE